jgi:hypothetical protein
MLYQELRRPFDCHSARCARPPVYKKGFVAQGRRHRNRCSPQWPSWKLDPRCRPNSFISRSIHHHSELFELFSIKNHSLLAFAAIPLFPHALAAANLDGEGSTLRFMDLRRRSHCRSTVAFVNSVPAYNSRGGKPFTGPYFVASH